MAMPPAGSHLLSVGGDKLERLVPQHREQPLPGRQEQHLQGLGPHVCFLLCWPPGPIYPPLPASWGQPPAPSPAQRPLSCAVQVAILSLCLDPVNGGSDLCN